jgi:DNA-binding transcriptional ArsR family regulator/uncharacterized protein YndB with AHSA1/START domain
MPPLEVRHREESNGVKPSPADQVDEGTDLDLLLRAIAHPIRREIVWLVWDQQLTAGELAARFDVTAPTVSQHLKLLREVGLVTVVADRAYRRYSARTERMAALRAALRPGQEDRQPPPRERPGAPPRAETFPCWEIVLRMGLATSPADAYRYFTDAESMIAWLGPSVSSDPRPGGTCRCGFATGERVRARFLHLVPGELLLVEWDYDGEPAPESYGNRVIVSFRPAPGGSGTELEVRHLSYVPGSAQFYQTSWAEFLARLQAAVAPAGHRER